MDEILASIRELTKLVKLLISKEIVDDVPEEVFADPLDSMEEFDQFCYKLKNEKTFMRSLVRSLK